MKTLLLVGLMSLSAHSQVPVEAKGDIYKAIGVEKEKMITFLKGKSNPCYIAVGRTVDQTEKGKGYFAPEVLCVLDGTLNEGTTRERTGCAFVVYNTAKGTMVGASRNEFGKPVMNMDGKDCSNGFLKLLKATSIKEFSTAGGAPRELSVGESLVSGAGTMFKTPELLFIHHKSYQNAYDDLKKKFSK